MGYQESILVCKNKNHFNKLCEALNAAKPELEEHVSIRAIGKLKSNLHILDAFCSQFNYKIPADSYFVWWAGECHPFQSGCNMNEDEVKVVSLLTKKRNYVIEYIADEGKLFDDIDTDKKGVLQENDTVWLFGLPNDEIIADKYIDMLDNHRSGIARKTMKKVVKKEILVYEFEGYFLEDFVVEVHFNENETKFFLYHKEYDYRVHMFSVPEILDEEEIKTRIDESIDFESYYYLDRFVDESKID